MNLDFNSVIENTQNGARIISQEHDINKIDWVRGLSDPGEMISCGYLPQLRRQSGETDEVYAARIRPMIEQLPANEREIILKRTIGAAIARANLNVSKGRVSMASALVSPWHRLGVLVDKAMTSKEALELANLAGWDLQKVEQQLNWDGRLIPTGTYGIIRADTGDLLTHGKMVGSRYEIVSNEDCFQLMDELISSSNGTAKFETAGAIGKGEQVWMLAQLPEWKVKDDWMLDYIICGTSHDGSSAMWIYNTNERVVCANTYRTSFSDRKNGFSFKHTKNVKERARIAINALKQAQEEKKKFEEVANHLANKQVGKPLAYFNLVLDDVLDVTIAGVKMTSKSIKDGEVLKAITKVTSIDERNSWERKYQNAFVKRKDILSDIITRYESETCGGSIKNTAWAALNAVTEHADHSRLWSKNTNENTRFESVLRGQAQEIKEVALEQILEYTK